MFIWLKEFLKPNWWKIILFVVIVVLGASVINEPDPRIADLPTTRGFPFELYFWGGLTDPPQGINYIGLILDVIIWYFFACLIYFIFAKIKNKFVTKE